MSHGVKYFCWRNGRPRWVPSVRLRRAGVKGVDLKDDSGNFLPLELSLKAAEAINTQHGITGEGRRPTRAAHSPQPLTGWIYFVRFTDFMKIGFSQRPVNRIAVIMQQQAHYAVAVTILRGTYDDEQRLHVALGGLRARGEWYSLSTALLRFVAASAERGVIAWDKLPPRTKSEQKSSP